jgi:acetolactate synthase I/II/III large subunit
MSDISRLARELVRLGTKHVFGIPGEGPSLILLDELEKLGCSFHLVAHEAAGALLAGGFGRAAGIPGISLSVKGPGFCNMLSGIASNWLDRNPALSISESYGPRSSPFRMHKRISHAAMAMPVVKAYADNISPDLIPKLWNLCLEEEPGPAHLDISDHMENLLVENSPPKSNGVSYLPAEVSRSIQKAQKPVVIAGGLGTRRAWREKLSALKVPVFTTFAGKGAVDESLPFSAGVFTNSGGPFAPESRLLPASDLAVGLGLRTTEILDVKPLPVPLLTLDEITARTDGLEPIIQLHATVAAFDESLEILKSKEWGASEVRSSKALLETKIQPCRWLPAGCFRTLQAILPESTVFVLDTGNFCTVGEHILTARHPLHIIGSTQGRSMGVGIPTAIGTALARPKLPTVIVVGDGGVRMYPDTVAIAVREKLPLLIVLTSDGFFSSIRQEAVKKGLAQDFPRLNSSNWTSVFKEFGCPAERVESMGHLENVVKAWTSTGGPLFLELIFDADLYANATEGVR